MSAIVGVDARIDMSTDGGVTWAPLPERNEFTISVSVDIAERKPFVSSLADAWVRKARTWMNWNGSLQGYHDDADDTIFDTVVAGQVVKLRFYDTISDLAKYWEGEVLLTNVEHGVTSEDFASLSVDFEGSGALSRVA